ncbi:glutamate receptor ionotropic, kainate 3-like [Leguminivora glycinivorella]|uniref:glutamate receptor ionotropic, kainate 3-like n=1 Tax=Leguminivora glycinivorella TaxID=1035111 RepID=UPI00200D2378|nr:glutamate receptor ionotropic, kainate 3-like [Leguminivora glycinivorella]
MMLRTIVIVLCVLVQCGFVQSEFVIGGLFYEGDELDATLANSAEHFGFQVSIKKVSRKRQLIEAGEHVCELANEGVIGIIDGTSGKVMAHVQAICDLLDIPHILIDHNDLITEDWFHLNLHPSPLAYNMVISKLVELKRWTNVTIMYEKGYSLMRVTDVLQMANKTMTVSIRELSGNDYRDVLINSKKNGYTNFIVDCPSKKLEQFLLHAQQVGLMADEHSYIFLSLDLFNKDLTSYRYGGVNMTGFMISKTTDWTTNQSYNEIKQYLIHDAVRLFNETVKSVKDMSVESGTVNCQDYNSWDYGSSVLNFMKTNKIEESTGPLIFDSSGERSDVQINIFELTSAGRQSMGEWNFKDNDIEINRPLLMIPDITGESIMRNLTFKILVAMVSPFCYLKESSTTLTGNDRYEGFAIDLFEKLADELEFQYEFEVTTLPYGGWVEEKNDADGITGEIYHGRADFGICDFTITSKRLQAIDFLIPFMSLGIAILYREPSKQPPAMFSFMEVFAPEVWYYMVLIQILLGVIMILVGRLSHKEWQNPQPCIEDPEELSNQFSFANSMWLIIGSVMQQGSEIAPIAFAPRMITSIWWFFTMIMVASYVGTLVAFLVVEKNVLPFENAYELIDKPIMYGAKDTGSTIQFFKESQDPRYRALYEKMEQKKWNAKSNDDGVAKAETSNYAFFMESPSIEYYKQRHCSLMQIGDLLDSKSYGIGIKKGSPYKKVMDDALLKLQENGELQKLKDLWWKEKRGGGKCGQETKEEEKQLGMKHMTGVFVVLGVGCILGIIISILDMLWGVMQRSVKYKTAFKYELVEELKFALKFSGDVKPVKRPAKTDESPGADVPAEAEGKDELRSLRSLSVRSASTRRSRSHSHSSRHSPSDLSVQFARRRRYSPS